MNPVRLSPLLRCLGIALLLWCCLARTAAMQTAGTVDGVVRDSSGPVAGAVVRVRATDSVTYTDANGQFRLAPLVQGEVIEVTAWAAGYYIASTHITPTVQGIIIVLRPHHTSDHPDYDWAEPSSCATCHPAIVSQWITNGHSGAVSDPRFFSLYNGTNIRGTESIAPGYLVDFPDTAGNCANCHAPAAAIDGYLTTNMNPLRGTVTAGIRCDYCHKIGGVYVVPETDLVYPNAPGVLSQRLLRPPPGDDIFFGPYDDVHDPDTYLPEISESTFCTPCHQFSMWGTPIYESFAEWQASPYADAGITCQDCHMPPTGNTYFALPEVGGVEHLPSQIPSHLQLGAKDEAFLQNTVTLSIAAKQQSDHIEAIVVMTNTHAGHHVPTDFPGRHLILTVSATDNSGEVLSQLSGPTVPAWGGQQAGQPGTAFAKVLQDVVSGAWPVVSYWRQSIIVDDNRIPALESHQSVYIFAAPPSGGPIKIEAELRLRRTFQDEMDARGWDLPDILMENAQITLAGEPWYEHFLPIAH